jgi:hypothetical protein
LPRVAARSAVEGKQSGIGVEVVRGGVGDDHIRLIAWTWTVLLFLGHRDMN